MSLAVSSTLHRNLLPSGIQALKNHCHFKNKKCPEWKTQNTSEKCCNNGGRGTTNGTYIAEIIHLRMEVPLNQDFPSTSISCIGLPTVYFVLLLTFWLKRSLIFSNAQLLSHLYYYKFHSRQFCPPFCWRPLHGRYP